MSYQVDSACYSTALEAAQVAASKVVGGVVENAGVAYFVDASSVASTSITYSLSPLGGGSPVVMVSPYSAQPCNLLQFEDGLQIGWMVGAAWIGAFAILFISRSLRGETVGTYGNS